MKKSPVFIALAFLLLSLPVHLVSQEWIKNLPQSKIQAGEELTYFEIQKAFNEYWEPLDVENGYYLENGIRRKASGWKQFKRWEWFWEDRVDPITGAFPSTSAAEIWQQMRRNSGIRNEDGNWKSLGPETTGGGTTWTVLTDENDALGVSDILVYPSPSPSTDTLYIATGDRDKGSLGSLGGGQFHDNNAIGVLKSVDGGSTWSANGLVWLPSDKKAINKLLKHPASSDSIYAAKSSKLWASYDGGATWIDKTGDLPVGSFKITYISVKHDDDSTVWVGLGEYNAFGVLESTGGSDDWDDISSGLPSIPVMCVVQNKLFTDSVELYAGAGDGSGSFLYRNAQGIGSLTSGIIPMGQGFFVQASGDSPSLTIPADARVHSSIDIYKKGSEIDEESPPFVVLEVNSGGKKDEVWISFLDGNTRGFDNGRDVHKLFSTENIPEIYIEEGIHKLSIDALPPLDDRPQVVSLDLEPDKTGEFIIELKELYEVDNVEIILEDLLIGDLQDLTSESSYTFFANDNDNPQRFLVHFNPISTGVEDPTDNLFSIYSLEKSIYIKSNGHSDNASVYGGKKVYDLRMKKVEKQKHKQLIY